MSIAGLKPYEIITAVDDQAVHTVDEFAQAIAAEGELVFSVKRMMQGRAVKVKSEPKVEEEATQDSP